MFSNLGITSSNDLKPAVSGTQTNLHNYPNWCNDLNKLPPLFLQIWKSVQLNETVCDTGRLYAILLSSGLSRDLLAQLWFQVNNTVPGQLTDKELFCILALIAFVQNNVSNPWNEMFKIEQPPLPKFSNLFQELEMQQPNERTISSIDSTFVNRALNNDQIKIDNDEFEDFCDFKSSTQFSNSIEESLEFGDFTSTVIESSKSNIVPLAGSTNTEVKVNSLSDPLLSNTSALTPLPFSQNTSIDISLQNQVMSQEKGKQNLSFSEETTNGHPVDRYSAFRDLTLHNDANSSDDFGDFRSHSNPETGSVDSLQFTNTTEIEDGNYAGRLQILQCCRQLIHKAFNVFVVSHGEGSSIEALNTEEGKAFILGEYLKERPYFNLLF